MPKSPNPYSTANLAAAGTLLLERVVLDVLDVADCPLTPAEIAEGASIFSDPVRGQTTNAITIGILHKLLHDGLVDFVQEYEGADRRWQRLILPKRRR